VVVVVIAEILALGHAVGVRRGFYKSCINP